MKFKIGDKVKVVGSGYTFDGEVGTIYEVDSTCCYVNDLSSPHEGSGWAVRKENLELVEDKPQAKFTVGDKVRNIYSGVIATVLAIPGMKKEYDDYNFIDAELGFRTENYGWKYQKEWELVRTPQREEVKEEETAEAGMGWGYEETKQPKKTLMKKVSTLARKLFDADTRALVEAGYLFDDLTLSSEGKNVLLDMLFLQYKKQMATEARKSIRAAKKCEEDEETEE